MSRTLQFGTALASSGTAGQPVPLLQLPNAAICRTAAAWRRSSAPERRRSPDCRCSAAIGKLYFPLPARLLVSLGSMHTPLPIDRTPAARQDARLQEQPSQNLFTGSVARLCLGTPGRINVAEHNQAKTPIQLLVCLERQCSITHLQSGSQEAVPARWTLKLAGGHRKMCTTFLVQIRLPFRNPSMSNCRSPRARHATRSNMKYRWLKSTASLPRSTRLTDRQ